MQRCCCSCSIRPGCCCSCSQCPPKSKSKSKSKSKKKRVKITREKVEKELDHIADCFEKRRLARLAKIPGDIKECIKAKKCCTPHPTNADRLFDRFVREREEDRVLFRTMKNQSACKELCKKKKRSSDTKIVKVEIVDLRDEEPCCC